ncbi:BatA domain-containing protein [Rhodopirellula sp. MGV]|uniref:BatA domain-containing protein n=1 Tax=Rhodopirellula sp. MGV TaxID=2023130 RepID=UPI000B970589|nr:BatA domain-containing protein [Rhodopirellula sp. MGV]OYP35761.1 hypothetical protein CGZ80_10815 [Rhodopirellula sp. MGV]PNY33656.1 hypothetical protein C2E31_26475 [Rhodopirellula baltica]
MSFLRVEALWALPLVLAPLIIHLLHRRRHPTMQWPAMMFLYQATKMRRGPAKLRRFLVLATRVAVLALIIFALARPLSSGLFGIAAGRIADTGKTVILIDRSTSMQRRDTLGRSRQERGLASVMETLQTLGIDQPIVIDNVTMKPIVAADLDSLTQTSIAKAADARASIDTMMMTAFEYLANQDATLVDVWIISDRNASSWNPDASTWEAMRRFQDTYGEGLRIHRFDFEANARQQNSSVRLTDLRWSKNQPTSEPSQQENAEQGVELLLSVVVESEQSQGTVPLNIKIGTTTHEVDVTLTGGKASLENYPLTVPGMVTGSGQANLYGSVSLPTDCNPADDDWYFTLSPPIKPVVAIVSEQPCDALIAMGEVIGEVAFDIAGGKLQNSTASTGDGANGAGQGGLQLDGIDSLWWQGQLPSGETAKTIESFCANGGSVAFFPPALPDTAIQFQGVHWNPWETGEPDETSFAGVKFMLDQVCTFDGSAVAASTLTDGTVWLSQRKSDRGSVWFCGANVTDHQNLFVRQGLGLFSVLAETIQDVDRQAVRNHEVLAGDDAAKRMIATATQIKPVLVPRQTSDGEMGYHRGVYSVSMGETQNRNVAINRGADDDRQLDDRQLDDEQLAALLPVRSVNVLALDGANLTEPQGATRELWGGLWLAMIAGLLIEGWLSLASRPATSSTNSTPNSSMRGQS